MIIEVIEMRDGVLVFSVSRVLDFEFLFQNGQISEGWV